MIWHWQYSAKLLSSISLKFSLQIQPFFIPSSSDSPFCHSTRISKARQCLVGWGSRLSGHTHKNFTQRSGICVPLNTKNHHSFPEPNQAVLCLNLAIAAQTLCVKKRQQPQMQKGPFYIREGLACQSATPKGALRVSINISMWRPGIRTGYHSKSHSK